ncbi:3-hydroxyacyl-ACP dehydratase FabZ family protein [Streptomyces broussonetiae]|uniref:ApeI dehydratase-like domain-containing protein n=1 Tax=Streptomyces broussonetiae TaxID=2686304 RepID=A0A6I6N7I9_9ACTN|nr:hypothetical protein [Streptomyces broussonetiae]QHA06589.1 hypothetical protein GQF42_27865 [Streptomyces broussonetiae]
MSAVTLLPGEILRRLDDTGVTLSVAVDPEAPVFAGHYPHFPLLPGVFLLDLTQRAVHRFAAEHGHRLSLESVLSARFLNPVTPGAEVTVDCTLAAGEDALWTVSGRCTADGEKAATFRLRYREP